MSQQSFVDYYDSFLMQSENDGLRQALEAAADEQEFARIAVEQGNANGFDFTADDVNAVMSGAEAAIGGSGASTVQIRSIASIENVQSRTSTELSDQELEAVAGGLASAGGSTLMCCW